jgi:hypothetical protein
LGTMLGQCTHLDRPRAGSVDDHWKVQGAPPDRTITGLTREARS